MIVRFFKTGTSNGEAPVQYLLSPRDHTGLNREHLPEVLEGSPALTIGLINGIDRKYKYASGCLAFRSTEQPTRSELLGIIDQFKKVVAPGLTVDQFNALFVLHREGAIAKRASYEALNTKKWDFPDKLSTFLTIDSCKLLIFNR